MITFRGKKPTIRGLRKLIRTSAKDLADLSIWLNPAARRKRAALDADNSLPALFRFAREEFGVSQREPEITGFLKYAAALRPRVVCEIGTLRGGTTFLLGRALPTVTTVIGMDLFIQNRQRLRYYNRKGQALHLLTGSSYASGTVGTVRRILDGRHIDILFIDGDHMYDGSGRTFWPIGSWSGTAA
jgi:predicted O-methyltransferase YrrM